MSDFNDNLPGDAASVTNAKYCKKCDRTDVQEGMVCCDVCDSWVHFQYAGVSESIAEPDRSWKCSDCMANWDAASKSAVSFNESSVSKSSRVSQKLQLSLQLLEEQQKLKKKRMEEERRIRRLEEEIRMKQIDDEQEYLRQKYALLMQIGEEKESCSRKSGVSVKIRREMMEQWLATETQKHAVGQSKPSASGLKGTLPVSATGAVTSNNMVPLNQGMVLLDPTIPIPGGGVTALAKSYESLVVPTMSTSTSNKASANSTIPVTVKTSAGGILVTSVTTAPIMSSLIVSMVTTVQSERNRLKYNRFDYFPAPAAHGNCPVLPPINPMQYSIASNGPPQLPSTTISSSLFPGIQSYPNAFPGYPVLFPYTGPSVVPTSMVVDGAGINHLVGPLGPTSANVFPGIQTHPGPIEGNRVNPSVALSGPTNAQLAARQVMPRDLPKFVGEPEQWPIFYSSFKNTTEVCGYTEAENLARLQRSLGGSALEAVRSRLLLPASVPYVTETLQKLYGRPEILISSLLTKVRSVPPPKADNLSTIVAYGLVIQNLVDHIILTDQQAHLSNPMLLQELIDKLPASLKLQWGAFKQAHLHVNLATFNTFMSGLVNLASELSVGVESAQNYSKQHKAEKFKPKEKLFTHANELPTSMKENTVGEISSKPCSFCEKNSHQILNCVSFKSLDIGGRWKAIRQKNLCRLCLIPHRKWPCRSKKECGVDGCRVRHNMLLHCSRNEAVDGARSAETVHHNHHHTKSYSLFRYLPVTLYGDGKQVETFAFLDDGSSSTLPEEEIATQLGIEGEPDNLWFSWTGKISRQEKTSKRLSVKISGVGLPVASYTNAKPGMIIGLEHVKLLTSLKIREGSCSEPVATKTRLRWCVYGRNSGDRGSMEQLHLHARVSMSNSDLHDSMRKFFAVEDAVVTKQIEAEEYKRARSILEATTVRKEARMETGLLWRIDNVKFPDSFPMAVSRLKGLEKRLAKDPELRRRVNEQIESYEKKQYVRVVTNPRKPNKIRMVWDAAAKANGVSFNDMLLKGPDLLVSLVEVLLRFREGKIAVCSDIREMFLRILIQLYPKAVDAIIRNHYVDDFLSSVNSVEEAVQLVRQVQLIHAAGGFEFGKILSSSQEVLDLLGETGTSDSKSLNLEKERVYERVLGVVWVPRADHFTFDRTGLEGILEGGMIPTKRQVLRTVMKLYDPLGFVAHFVVQGKILMQEIWRTGTNWDEPISESLHNLWSRWIEVYLTISEVRVPRCFLGHLLPEEIDEIELHVFTDASVASCACVAYLRMSYSGGGWCSLVAAKTKVAPLRALSIPRLELEAAMMGSRLLQKILTALTLNIRRHFLWTDSATVLAWLRSDSRRYHQFVSFRVGEILSLTSVDEWRYVPSKLNVADDATKWNSGPSFDPENRWYQGPPFLRNPIEQWPGQSVVEDEADVACEELRLVGVHQAAEEVIRVERFSNWDRLLRAMAYVHRAVRIWKRTLGRKSRRHVLDQEDIVKAMETLWRQAQSQAYVEEVHALNHGCSVGRSSPLYPLVPFIDEHEVVRIGSRIGSAPHIPYATKYPVVLPRDHRITFLLVQSVHRRFLHANGETVCNELRQEFYIPKLRVFVKKVSRSCQYCKVKKSTPRPPLMGPLPRVRLTPFIRPFTFAGVDYMGPLEVRVGRCVAKRWICLFTCLTVRAVHLELVHSLSSASCVMAFRRFVARRGAPQEVFSDNGTNFVGANRQLSEEKKKIRDIVQDCAATFTNANTQWHFNVPAAPHMGGPWERMVKSVKVAMKAVSDSPRHPSDEVLETIMLEAEAIVNSRPLTYVSLEAEDDEALTPNHFLLYGRTGFKQPITEPVQGNILRDSWKLVQHIIDDFWHRWVREYLPMLTRRTKWFEPVKPLKPGDLVVIIDEQARNRWERGRVLETFPDKSGQVRRATVQTARGVLARPAVKLAVLDVTGEEDTGVVTPETKVVHGSGNVAETPRCGEKGVNNKPFHIERKGPSEQNDN
ncbi:uncharacterized protein LOC129729278 [Wyeomyia smithii]|uniref:uncharacterized protein LOC129729278 n=1 Tax=Wyeomyia smithii TaxID=174621 RepID=UPI002467B450|nr:uncharacterized protein LOC129729278 [Wyeomyia smithii]